MNEQSDLRDKIARSLFEAYGDTTSPGWDAEYPSMKRTYFDQADAVLAVLADLPESVIERAAAQLYYWDIHPTSLDWEERPSGGQEDYREGARAMFRAAFGGEQSDG